MLLMFAVFVVVAFLGMPVAFAMALAGTVGVFQAGVPSTMIVPQQVFKALDSFPLMAVPFFVLTGELMNRGGITRRVVDFARALVGRFRGDLANVNVVANMVMSGFSGSATADAVAVGTVMIPAMAERGYPRGFAAGLTAAASCMGPIIPPSIAMVIYAGITGVSVGALFLAGVIPGILVGLALLVLVQVYARRYGWPASPPPSWRQFLRTLRESFWALIAPAIVLGGIVTGVATATEAGVVAAVYALVISLFVYREITWRDLPRIFARSALSTAIPLITIPGSNLFGWVLAYERFSYAFTQLVTAVTSSPEVMILLIIAMLFAVGIFVEGLPILLIFVPVLFPIGQSLGLNEIHWAMVIILTVMLASVTPPVGIQLYVAAHIARIPVAEVVMWPFIWVMLVVVLLVAYAPGVTLWLPTLFGLGQ